MKRYHLPVNVVGFKNLSDGSLSGDKRQILFDEPVVKVGGTKKRPLYRTSDGYMAFVDAEFVIAE